MSFPRYPKYKDSGVEWLGQVPEHWESCALKRIASLQSGEFIDSASIEEAGEFPVFGGNGLRGFTSSYTHDGSFALIGRQGALCGNVNYATGKFWPSEHAVVATPVKPVATRWLGEMLRAMDLNRYSTSAAQPGLSVEAIGGIQTVYPPIEEQAAIASFLDHETAKIDALVAEQEQLIELLKEKRQAVISQTVTTGLDPSVQMKSSGLEWFAEIPHHWEVVALKRLARDGDRTFIDGDWIESPYITTEGVRLIQTGNIGVGHYKEQGFRYVSAETFRLLRCTEVEPRDVLICRLDGPVGRACLAPDLGVVMITSVDNAILKCATNVVPEFVVAILSSDLWINWVDALCRVGGGFRLRVSRGQLGELRVPMPPHHEQVAIVKHLASESAKWQQLIASAEHSISLLQERRTALISAAVTGQIDVRGAAGSS